MDWQSINITKKEILMNLGIHVGNKREPVFDSNQILVPFYILSGHDNKIRYLNMNIHIKWRNWTSFLIRYKEHPMSSKDDPIKDQAKPGESQSPSAHQADDPKPPRKQESLLNYKKKKQGSSSNEWRRRNTSHPTLGYSKSDYARILFCNEQRCPETGKRTEISNKQGIHLHWPLCRRRK